MFLSDGHGGYTPLDNGKSPVNDINSKGYRVFTIGLAVEPQSEEENILKDIASNTGGKYFSLSSEKHSSNIVNSIFKEIAGLSNIHSLRRN